MKATLGVSILGICILVAMPGCMGMTLVVENDSFATFQPFNDQWRGGPDVSYRSGVLLQVSDFIDAKHAYDWIKLYDSSDTLVQTIQRGGAAWIDIECGVTDQKPITPAQAAQLRPDPTHLNRRLHLDLTTGKELIPITLWEPEKGVKIETHRTETATGKERGSGHGHVKYVVTTHETCAVRVWDDQQQTANTYAAGKIRRIRVGEENPPTEHGGPHSPPWLVN